MRADTRNDNAVRPILLYVTAFAAGFVIMALELLGFRVLAPYFGYSIYVSGSLIGIVLSALAIGYIVGGRIADRNARLEILWGLILAAALLSFLGGLLYRNVLNWFEPIGPIYGALLGSIVIFGPSMVLLSMVSPFIIKMISCEGRIGRSAGNIYGAATIGSIAGVFLTSFLLLPAVGSAMTFNIAGTTLLVLSISGFAACRRYFAFAGVALLGFYLVPPPASAPGVLLEKESMYSRLYVVEDGGIRRLSTCRDQWWYSFESGKSRLSGTVLDSFLLGPIIKNDCRDVLVLGMGAGTSVKQLLHFFPGIEHVDAVDIDPEIVRLAEKYFDVKSNEKLTTHVADARVYLSQTSKKYDFVEIDLFHQGPYIPFYVATREFFELIRSRLNEGGVLIYNVITPLGDNALFDLIEPTVAAVFPSVMYIPSWKITASVTNTIIVGLNRTASLTEVKDAIENCTVPGLEKLSVDNSRNIKERAVKTNANILSDDSASIEIENFLLVQRFMERVKSGNKERKQ